MDHSFKDPPNDRARRSIIRVLGAAAVVALILPMVWGVVYQQILAPSPAPPVKVVVMNGTDATYIVWASADPSPVPSGDYVLERRGFEVAPHSIAWLPNDRLWDPVEVWTFDCVLVTEDATPIEPGSVVEIEASGSVRVVPDQIRGERVPARATDRCALVPWTPTP